MFFASFAMFKILKILFKFSFSRGSLIFKNSMQWEIEPYINRLYWIFACLRNCSQITASFRDKSSLLGSKETNSGYCIVFLWYSSIFKTWKLRKVIFLKTFTFNSLISLIFLFFSHYRGLKVILDLLGRRAILGMSESRGLKGLRAIKVIIIVTCEYF